MTQARPTIIGFDEPPTSTAERVAELLHAARAAIIPPPKPALPALDQTNGTKSPLAGKLGPEQIIHDLDQIAQTLRSDDILDRSALAAALDGVREALTGLLAPRAIQTSAADQSATSAPSISPRSGVPLDVSRDILQPEEELRHAALEEARG